MADNVILNGYELAHREVLCRAGGCPACEIVKLRQALDLMRPAFALGGPGHNAADRWAMGAQYWHKRAVEAEGRVAELSASLERPVPEPGVTSLATENAGGQAVHVTSEWLLCASPGCAQRAVNGQFCLAHAPYAVGPYYYQHGDFIWATTSTGEIVSTDAGQTWQDVTPPFDSGKIEKFDE